MEQRETPEGAVEDGVITHLGLPRAEDLPDDAYRLTPAGQARTDAEAAKPAERYALVARHRQPQPEPCPGCESLRRQCSELAGEVGALAGTLRAIWDAHQAGTHAHDAAHAALDRLHGLRPAAQPAPELADPATPQQAGRISALARQVREAWNREFTGAPATAVDFRMAEVAVEAVLAAQERPAPELRALEILQADAAQTREAMAEITRIHDELIEAVLKNTGDEWDQDAAAEAIAERYVRWLEGEVERLKQPQAAPELAAAMRETRLYRERFTALAEELEAGAAQTAPSKKPAIEEAVAAKVRKILEGR